MIRLLTHSILVVSCLVAFSPHTVRASSSELDEFEVKAAYLYNFAKFVEWPVAVFPRENTPLTMCIAGKSPVNEAVESLAGKTIRNRRLLLRQISRVEDLNECHILFVNASAKTPLNQILAATASRPILTVSDYKGFSAAGGMIEFVLVGDKIRFEINKRSAQHVNLKISSHLLRLATTVLE